MDFYDLCRANNNQEHVPRNFELYAKRDNANFDKTRCMDQFEVHRCITVKMHQNDESRAKY